MIQRHFKLALTAGHSLPLVINANQYDSGEQWLFTLYNDGVKYTPSTGAIVGIKADRLGIINTGTVDANGRVVINETRQMTAAVGKNIFELLIDDQTHGTANFMVLVEPRPGDNADLSESDYSLFEEAINGTSQAAIKAGVQEWMDENLTDPTDPIVDASLSLSGAAADAKKTGDEISELKSAISQSTGMSAEFKQALEALVNAVSYKGEDPTGRTYINALHAAMYPPANLTSISAVYTQSGTVYNTDSIESLRSDLVVTAHYDNATTEIVTAYTLRGTLTVGTSTITVSYGGKTTTFNVTVTLNETLYELASETAFTQTSNIDTGVKFEAGNVYTVLIDVTIAETAITSNRDIFGNRQTQQSGYAQLSTVKSGSTYYYYGMGISYSNGSGISGQNNRIRSAIVVDAVNFSYTHSYKNLTKNTSNTFTNASSEGAICRNANIFLGCAEGAGNTGFTGTMHSFEIIARQLDSTEINDFLTNGA